METRHSVIFSSAADMAPLADDSIDLIVTSPPYPMIEMWDQGFVEQDPEIGTHLDNLDADGACQRMHAALDNVWRECARVLRPGAFACINIGDATRTIGTNFRLYTNHSRITHACESLGMQSLPAILWRKQTNAPNTFMGSGLLPAGAYVTLEHEYILIFRNGPKRTFRSDERERRRASAFFREERNAWFSDLWDFKGTRQQLKPAAARTRSGAFPFELAFRLINMYSLYGDTVLDPFVGTGTTLTAAIAAARTSIGIEIDPLLGETIDDTIAAFAPRANTRQNQRYHDHLAFAGTYAETKGAALGYTNGPHHLPVMTRQETDLELLIAAEIERTAGCEYRVRHQSLTDQSSADQPQPPRTIGIEPPADPSGQLSFFPGE
ncbi:MAG: site-specific DNA-methyltransferase [Spirochaeta sp.]|jgi:DNA modification methylase|nr:site-specific DNA-methyltransferase [Spirochaeta sp.]